MARPLFFSMRGISTKPPKGTAFSARRHVLTTEPPLHRARANCFCDRLKANEAFLRGAFFESGAELA